ncbi:hypothetical protein JYU34_012607 [Plutella xylostella]|uniref:Uncharacterized protein n=1 Tax=Plutella xylostella TaxID=51655 RepID=A0ABQ7QBU1_PLUXY|nr:hypothetical protein JYU34_012607 [Plutella xylostella]
MQLSICPREWTSNEPARPPSMNGGILLDSIAVRPRASSLAGPRPTPCTTPASAPARRPTGPGRRDTRVHPVTRARRARPARTARPARRTAPGHASRTHSRSLTSRRRPGSKILRPMGCRRIRWRRSTG